MERLGQADVVSTLARFDTNVISSDWVRLPVTLLCLLVHCIGWAASSFASGTTHSTSRCCGASRFQMAVSPILEVGILGLVIMSP